MFGRNKAAKTGVLGEFTSPHPPSDTLQAVYAGLAARLSKPDESNPAPFEQATPGILASIYISRLAGDGMTVTAGNTVEKFFEFHVDVSPSAHGTLGRAYFDRPIDSITRWMGDAIAIAGGVRIALHGASADLSGWRV